MGNPSEEINQKSNEELEEKANEETKDELAEEVAEETKPEKENKKAKITKEIKKLQSEKKDLESKLSEYDDKYKRLAAEYDNFRKRSQKERENAYTDAYSDALKEILPVIDNIERAMAFVSDDPNDNLSKGVVLTAKQFEEIIKKMGIESFGQPGEQFDPNFHNAVMHEEDESKGTNEITDVFMKGYKRGDRIIRYAMVKTVN